MQRPDSSLLPTRAALQPAALYLELREIASENLLDPFMQQTVVRIPAQPSFVAIAKADLGKEPSDTAPSALIFHVGRCGSTLISQLLKQCEQRVVYAEPLPMNEILSPPHKWEREELIGALRSLGGAFSRHSQRPYILKCSSWNTLYCDIIADAFPSTPWVFSIRDPVPVCVSLLGDRPGWLRDAGTSTNLFSSIVDPDQSCRTPEEFLARLYGAYCRAIERLDTKRGRLIPYEWLPAATWESVAPHFGLTVSGAVKSRMLEASRTHSKSPLGKTATFTPDESKKRDAASHDLLKAIDAYARPELERLRARFSTLGYSSHTNDQHGDEFHPRS